MAHSVDLLSKPDVHLHLDVEKLSEETQREKGDSLSEGHISNLPEAVYMELKQNNFSILKGIWKQFGTERQKIFQEKYGDIALLLYVDVDEQMIKAAALFWDPAYRCFIFNNQDLMPTIEEYTKLLRLKLPKPNKLCYVEQKKVGYRKKLAQLLGVDPKIIEQRVKKKGESESIPWDLLRHYILEYLEEDRALDIFALAIYGLVLFPKAIGYVEAAVVNLFDQIGKQSNPVPSIIAETIRSLNYCRKKGGERFIGCA